MPRILSRALVAATIIGSAAGLTAASHQQPAAALTRVRSGQYKLYQRIGQDTTKTETGTETFKILNYSDNTLVINGEQVLNYQLIRGPAEPLRTKTHLEVEEESLFPRRYKMTKFGQAVDQELNLEMVANVAVIDYRLNKQREKHESVLNTGDMIVEGSVMCQRWLLLQRFEAGFSGKLSMTVFDPLLRRESPVELDYLGEETTTLQGKTGTFKLYRLAIEKTAEMKLLTDDSGMIVQADNGAQKFVLVEFKDETVAPSGD